MAKRSSTAIASEREGLMELYQKENGWLTTRVTKKSTWSKGKDYFGIGDIMAYRFGVTKLTDVSSYNIIGKIDIMKKWMLDNIDDIPIELECEVAIWKPKSKTKPERFLVTTISRYGVTSKHEVAVKPEWYDLLKSGIDVKKANVEMSEIVTLPADYVPDDCDCLMKVLYDGDKIVKGKWKCIHCDKIYCLHDYDPKAVARDLVMKCTICGEVKAI